MLKIQNITATYNDRPILQNIDAKINQGEIHAIIGNKNSGKTSLAHLISGHPRIKIESGSITFQNKKIHTLNAYERSKKGIFVSFQLPPEYDFITNWELAEESLKNIKGNSKTLELKYKATCEYLQLENDHGDRLALAEKSTSVLKRNELVYMLLSNPKLVILDEIDDGLSDSEKHLVGSMLHDFLREENRSSIIFSKDTDFLKLIKPTNIHVMAGGEIKVSGQSELCKRIFEDGYPEFS